MPEAWQQRVSRELFVAAAGARFGEFEPWVTDRLVSMLEEESLHADDPLFRAGEAPEYIYFVRDGSIRLTREGDRTRELAGRRILGMLDGLIDRPRRATAVAGSDLHVMRVRIDAWLELLEDSFPLARAMVVELASRVAESEERLATRADDAREGHRRAATRPPVAPLDKPLNVVERLAALTQVEFLRNAGVQPLADLALACEERFFEQGEVLVAGDARLERVFVVLAGQVEVSWRSQRVLSRAVPGEMVCGAAAFAEPARGWTGRATCRGHALSFRIEDWFDLMEEHFDLVRAALTDLSLRLDALVDALP